MVYSEITLNHGSKVGARILHFLNNIDFLSLTAFLRAGEIGHNCSSCSEINNERNIFACRHPCRPVFLIVTSLAGVTKLADWRVAR